MIQPGTKKSTCARKVASERGTEARGSSEPVGQGADIEQLIRSEQPGTKKSIVFPDPLEHPKLVERELDLPTLRFGERGFAKQYFFLFRVVRSCAVFSNCFSRALAQRGLMPFFSRGLASYGLASLRAKMFELLACTPATQPKDRKSFDACLAEPSAAVSDMLASAPAMQPDGRKSCGSCVAGLSAAVSPMLSPKHFADHACVPTRSGCFWDHPVAPGECPGGVQRLPREAPGGPKAREGPRGPRARRGGPKTVKTVEADGENRVAGARNP